VIRIESRRKNLETVRRAHPDALIIDVTSRAQEPWVKFSPFYPVPPQNPVNVAIVGVSVLGVRLAYPDASVIDAEIRTLIRRVASENPTWEAPRIHSELLMLGVEWRGDLRPPGGCRARPPHPELSAVPMRIRALSASPSSRASRPTARGGRRFEERQVLKEVHWSFSGRRPGDIGRDLGYEAGLGVICTLAATAAASYQGYRQSRTETNTTWLKVQSNVSRTGASGSSKPLPATTSFSTCRTWKACALKSCAKDSGSHSTRAKVPRGPARRTSAHFRTVEKI
jgi:hypothetical protein